MGSFKCARLQGSNFYTTYLVDDWKNNLTYLKSLITFKLKKNFQIRTIEQHFADSIQVKLLVGDLTMPRIEVHAGANNFNSTGGLCGRWNNEHANDLYVLDQQGQEDFNASIVQVSEFWRLVFWETNKNNKITDFNIGSKKIDSIQDTTSRRRTSDARSATPCRKEASIVHVIISICLMKTIMSWEITPDRPFVRSRGINVFMSIFLWHFFLLCTNLNKLLK